MIVYVNKIEGYRGSGMKAWILYIYIYIGFIVPAVLDYLWFYNLLVYA